MAIVAEQTFVPPGPGSWFLDPTHWTRPLPTSHAEIFPDAFKRGFSESPRRYGSLLEYLDAGFANGFPYLCARPVGAPREAAGHPRRRCGTSSRALTRRAGVAFQQAQPCSSASSGTRTSTAGTGR
jgi:hypothetical protein